MSWQSSNMPSIARLKMFASLRENICARWNGVIFPCGESMKTLMRALPLSACSAAEPVSPLVAPSTFRLRSCFSSTCSKSRPRSCSAMSLKASVGPLESPRMWRFGSSVRSGVVGGEEAQDLEGEARVRQVAHRVELHAHDPRPLLGHHQSAVGREPFEEDVGEQLGRGVAACADVFYFR